MKFIATFLSVVFHPLILPTYATLIIVWANPAIFDYLGIDQGILILRVILNTFIFPIIIILIAIPLGFVSSIYMKERQERILPFIITIFFYVWAFFSFFQEGVTPRIFNIILLGALISTIISFMMNLLVMKISVHTVGMGVLIGLILALVPSSEKNLIPVLLIFILIAGAIGTARLLLNSHTQKEIYLGYLVGLFSQLLAIQLLFLN